MKQTLFLLGLAAVFLLTACLRTIPKQAEETESSDASTGRLSSFSYSPGYSDMDGESHFERLEKDGNGEWRIVRRSRGSIDEPMTVTTFSVSADAVSRFDTFLRENKVMSLADRPDSDLFAEDYSPWMYRLEFDPVPDGTDAPETYTIREFQEYSDRDYDLLKDLNREFESLFGEIISVTEESESGFHPSGFEGEKLYVNIDGETLVYERYEAGTSSLTPGTVLDSFSEETEIEGIVWDVYSAEEYPDLSFLLVISGTNSSWTYRISEDTP